MKIYDIMPRTNDFRALTFVDSTIAERVKFVSQPLRSMWPSRVECYIYEPNLAAGDFLGVSGVFGTIACTDTTASLTDMKDLFELSGELLPVYVNGVRYWLINCLRSFALLDEQRSAWTPMPSGRRIGRPKRYVFHSDRLPSTPLFKIPETQATQILCASGVDVDHDFRSAYERLGLTGLKFTELWSGDKT